MAENTTLEQQARDLLERAGIENAQSFTAGDLVEIANLLGRIEVQSAPAVREPFDRTTALVLLQAASKSGDPGAISLAAQLAGAAPCTDCGYVNFKCRCAAPAAPAVPDPWKSAVLDRLAATCMDAQQDEPPASILRRIINWEVTVALDPAVSDIAPYLCIKPACGPDCSGCNCAISPQDMRDYAVRYAILRNAPIDAIRDGGVFAGKTPDNVVLNGEHLDAAVDALRGITGDSK